MFRHAITHNSAASSSGGGGAYGGTWGYAYNQYNPFHGYQQHPVSHQSSWSSTEEDRSSVSRRRLRARRRSVMYFMCVAVITLAVAAIIAFCVWITSSDGGNLLPVPVIPTPGPYGEKTVMLPNTLEKNNLVKVSVTTAKLDATIRLAEAYRPEYSDKGSAAFAELQTRVCTEWQQAYSGGTGSASSLETCRVTAVRAGSTVVDVALAVKHETQSNVQSLAPVSRVTHVVPPCEMHSEGSLSGTCEGSNVESESTNTFLKETQTNSMYSACDSNACLPQKWDVCRSIVEQSLTDLGSAVLRSQCECYRGRSRNLADTACKECMRDCTGREDGDYHSCISCTMYATCTNGRLIDGRSCPLGWRGPLVWDAKSRRCDYTSPTCHESQCVPNPCSNGGTCSVNAGSFQCACADGWEGTTCDTEMSSGMGPPIGERVRRALALSYVYEEDMYEYDNITSDGDNVTL